MRQVRGFRMSLVGAGVLAGALIIVLASMPAVSMPAARATTAAV
jgi:hypothetical protein